MAIDKDKYGKLTKTQSSKSPLAKNMFMAFLFGGLICAIAQGIYNALLALGLSLEQVNGFVPIIMIFLGGLLTALGVYDDMAKHAGAGTIVPITGFSNAVVSPAMEFKAEGLVLGIGAKMFVIAGPVLVYGFTASVIYGFIYWVIKMF